ncbi:MAG TPA: DUF2189 domain-containing protein [Accumulibacter sp.]|uniref:DUF2189 domain-containing protein n=1 Tax=Accumulibacter sp. TaxID=2053492 RepID=UPI002CBA0494|nr:DUF2189 domain-containing protein [Accumulibacter sp.]HMV04124.1 DUF2189 domain-containing protein [Accumulibacter sp.]HMW79655.1 DUF2189 domain-containing protein [Accumulibacter sp.]HND38827.1 DUF2189 domain-containing protein [Accumulibacter sp.]HNH92725.1 DUF2189 domain-containing protein [Accumulibacter sp.]HNI50595.1 DUF2189 domain-containing protein [Accumulibacter sp.]
MSQPLPPPSPAATLPGIRQVALSRPFAWLAAGWRDLLANPIASLAYGLLFAIAGDLITIFAWRNGHVFIAATSGFFLVAPLLSGGLYEISRRRESGQSSTFFSSLGGGRRNRLELLKLGLLLGAVGLLWERLSTGLFHLLAPDLTPDLLKLLAVVHTSSEHRDLLLIWLLSGGTLALLIFSVTVVSVPLLLDRPLGLLVALRTSLRSVDANLLLMILWGAIIVVLTALGFLTLFFGLIVLMPLIGHASWHAYRELVE